ncbi:Flagellar assembly regulator FliX, class II [Magnetospirillum sp. LM-5]|nr:Flagellar assembly regulator FliX, class II [Magnetospirillum sp. LM-5]
MKATTTLEKVGIMKVSGVGSGAPAGGARKTDKADGKKGEFKRVLVDAMGAGDETHAADGASSISVVEGALMIQDVGGATDREARQRLVRHGEELLDKLEEIRHGLLLGTVPVDKLEALASSVRSRREACPDPRLAALLDEIELRAEVEIAKLTRGR